MLEAFQNLVRSLVGRVTPRIDGLDCDCGGSDCGGSDCGGSDCNSSECNASDCDSGDSSKAAELGSSVESSSDAAGSSDCSGSSSDRRARDAGLVGGAVVGAAAAHHHRKKGQRNANDATEQDLAAIPRCQRAECRQRGKCDCGAEPYGKRPVRIRLRKQ